LSGPDIAAKGRSVARVQSLAVSTNHDGTATGAQASSPRSNVTNDMTKPRSDSWRWRAAHGGRLVERPGQHRQSADVTQSASVLVERHDARLVRDDGHLAVQLARGAPATLPSPSAWPHLRGPAPPTSDSPSTAKSHPTGGPIPASAAARPDPPPGVLGVIRRVPCRHVVIVHHRAPAPRASRPARRAVQAGTRDRGPYRNRRSPDSSRRRHRGVPTKI
jgi:hypothetical protein